MKWDGERERRTKVVVGAEWKKLWVITYDIQYVVSVHGIRTTKRSSNGASQQSKKIRASENENVKASFPTQED